jgi:hypothetical protein
MAILTVYNDVRLLVHILKVGQLCFVYACDCMEISKISNTKLFFIINFLERVSVAAVFLFINEKLWTQYVMFLVLEATNFRLQLLTPFCLWFVTSMLLNFFFVNEA